MLATGFGRRRRVIVYTSEYTCRWGALERQYMGLKNVLVRACAAALIATAASANAAVVMSVNDGFGDGDRDNFGLDTGATATDPSDVGIPWLLTDGTSAVTFRAIDDTGGINTGNAMQLFNTLSNNRPSVGHFSP